MASSLLIRAAPDVPRLVVGLASGAPFPTSRTQQLRRLIAPAPFRYFVLATTASECQLRHIGGRAMRDAVRWCHFN